MGVGDVHQVGLRSVVGGSLGSVVGVDLSPRDGGPAVPVVGASLGGSLPNTGGGMSGASLRKL